MVNKDEYKVKIRVIFQYNSLLPMVVYRTCWLISRLMRRFCPLNRWTKTGSHTGSALTGNIYFIYFHFFSELIIEVYNTIQT